MYVFLIIWISVILLKCLDIKLFSEIKWGWIFIAPLLYVIIRILWEIFGYIFAIIFLFGIVYYFAEFGSFIMK